MSEKTSFGVAPFGIDFPEREHNVSRFVYESLFRQAFAAGRARIVQTHFTRFFLALLCHSFIVALMRNLVETTRLACLGIEGPWPIRETVDHVFVKTKVGNLAGTVVVDDSFFNYVAV